ncbi:putative kinase inhibitor protein [Corynebacterium endometrii]|uniref:Putative kinase inhibitor protein n=2 Tax=Corynebacterium endometrii TaxID=2488819 RepID=A0A4P7QFG8_9CORY|nr:putative kinase inhibitor protein [Corynebacterium endometrii]
MNSGTTVGMTTYDDSRFPGPDPYAPLKDLPSFTLASQDLIDGDEIEEKFRAPQNVSPQLEWSNLPEGTKSLAVTCFDPDAPTASGFWHWAAFNIPADVTELPTGAGSAEDLGIPGVVSLKNDSGSRTYYGPQPPAGHAPHRYLYAVHAVDVEKLDVDAGDSPTVLGFNLHFHAIGRAILWGWYEEK